MALYVSSKVFLIGNKIDLENERQITREQGEQFCKDNKLNGFMESSAKTGINAQRIFIKAAETLYEDYLKYQQNTNDVIGEDTTKNKPTSQVIDRKRIDNKPRKKQGGCC